MFTKSKLKFLLATTNFFQTVDAFWATNFYKHETHQHYSILFDFSHYFHKKKTFLADGAITFSEQLHLSVSKM